MTTTTRYEIQTRTTSTPWQREASSDDYGTRSAAEADAAKLEPTNDDGAAIEYRVVEIEREDVVPCGCGAAMGEPCEWSGPKSETVLVEWMPEHLRASHSAAGNLGEYPHNGAIRFRAERSCAERIAESDPEWTEIR